MPEPFEIPSELSRYWGKQVNRIDRPRRGAMCPDSTVTGIMFYSGSAGLAHPAGWVVALRHYDGTSSIVSLSEFLENWEVRK